MGKIERLTTRNFEISPALLSADYVDIMHLEGLDLSWDKPVFRLTKPELVELKVAIVEYLENM